VVITFVSTVAGAIVVPFVQSRFWPDIDGQQTGNSGLAAAARMIGVVLGFGAALLGIALHGRLSGIRPLTTYPAVIRLRQEGWHFPIHSAE
jgi:hypothetical protein